MILTVKNNTGSVELWWTLPVGIAQDIRISSDTKHHTQGTLPQCCLQALSESNQSKLVAIDIVNVIERGFAARILFLSLRRMKKASRAVGEFVHRMRAIIIVGGGRDTTPSPICHVNAGSSSSSLTVSGHGSTHGIHGGTA